MRTRVFFVYRTQEGPYGGANTFNRLLRETYQRSPQHGIDPVSHLKEADVLFLNAASRGPHERFFFSLRRFSFTRGSKDVSLLPWQLRNLRSGRPVHHMAGLLGLEGSSTIPVVHRLDGVTSHYGRRDGRSYDRLQIALNHQSAFTVFQSAFCRESFSSLLEQNNNYAVITNGADGDIFRWNPRPKPAGTIRILAAGWSSNPVKGHAALVSLARLPKVQVCYAGRWPVDVRPENVQLVSIVSQTKLSKLMADAHIFAHFAFNDPAPNVVTEALATGLPVLYRNSGGTPELVHGSRFGEPLTDLSEASLSTALERLRDRYENFLEEIKDERETFLITRTAASYAAIFHATA